MGTELSKHLMSKKNDHNHGHTHNDENRHNEHDHHGGVFGENTELIFSIFAGVLLAIGYGLEKFEIQSSIVKIIYIASYLAGGFFPTKEAFENIKAKKLEIDSLMILAALGAAFLGEWPEGALLLTLFSLGHALEHYAMGRAKKAVEALADLAPEIAVVRRNGQLEEISIDQLVVGDVVIVKPNERIAADGFVIKGESSVDQSAVTGESIPVDKQPISANAPEREKTNPLYRVFSGTINGSGSLEIQVSKLSSESTLSKVIQMVSEAESKKSPTQLFTDRFERIFVPSVLLLVAILPFACFVINESWQTSFYRAMAVLVAASPCALAIATPSAVLSAVARAAKAGVLVKGGGPLEELGELTAIAFDKTGTLTEGRPKVTDVQSFNGVKKDDLVSVAFAVEKLSDHPLAAAIVQYGDQGKDFILDKNLFAEDVKSITGKGVSAKVNNEIVLIGKRSLFAETELPYEISKVVDGLQNTGRTLMLVKFGEKFLGIFGLMDTPRESAKSVIQELKSNGIEQMIMLSGDNQVVASAVANELGLSDAKGDLMPEDKVTLIRELRSKRKVAMVGDGVNDAPAMTQATVAIAMGAAGSDVALQTADIALMADDLTALPFAVALSRKTRVIVKQNLWISLGVVAILIPATILGLKMGLAVAAHEGSTLVVVFNALRLLGFKKQNLKV